MMPNMQNYYTNENSGRTMDGRQMGPMDWTTEITAAPPSRTQNGVMPESVAGNKEDLMMQQRMQTVAPHMSHGKSAEVIEMPTDTQEAYLGSLKAMLNQNKGAYIVATFLVGTQNTVSWEGILYEVGNDFITIYQPGRDRYIVTDMYSLKYMEFYDTERREMCNMILRQNEWRQNS